MPHPLLQFAHSDTEQTVRDDARTSSDAVVSGCVLHALAFARESSSGWGLEPVAADVGKDQ
jgi:hypothetical protein